LAEEVKVEVRPKAYVIGTIAVVLVVTFVAFLALFSRAGAVFQLVANVWDLMVYTDIMFVFFWPILLSGITALIVKNGKGLNKQELALIVSMVWVAWIIPTYYGVVSSMTLVGTARAIPAFQKWTMDWGRVNNWKFGPDPMVAAYWESWMYGGPVPWGAWMPAIAIWILTILPFYLSFLFLAALWRRQWVDIEVLPFPYATGAASLINMAYERDEKRVPRILTNMFLWSGVVVGFFAIFPYWAPVLLPGLGLTAPANAGYGFGYDLTPLALVPWVPLNFNFEPFWIGALFLVPTTTLFSYIITTLITRFIWPPLMVALGIWDAMSPGNYAFGVQYGAMWRGWTGPLGRVWTHTWGAVAWLGIGAIMGLNLYPLLVFRGDVAEMIRSVFGKGRREVEEKEPMKYRYLWAGYITCILLYSIAWWYRSEGNLPLAAGFLVTIGYHLYYGIGMARSSAEFGQPVNTQDDTYLHIWNYNAKVWWLADPASPFFIRNLQTRYLTMRADLFYCGEIIRGNPASYALEAFKIGSITGLHSKRIFLGAAIAVIVGVITTYFVFLPMWHIYGATLEGIRSKS